MNIVAVVQARTSSKRFPNKILKKINNLAIIEIIIERLKRSKKISQIVVATTKNPSDDKINRTMNGLCRCGTYPRIKKAIKKAGKLMEI